MANPKKPILAKYLSHEKKLQHRKRFVMFKDFIPPLAIENMDFINVVSNVFQLCYKFVFLHHGSTCTGIHNWLNLVDLPQGLQPQITFGHPCFFAFGQLIISWTYKVQHNTLHLFMFNLKSIGH